MSNNTPESNEQLPYGPDAIWAPWRLPYLEDLGASENPPGKAKTTGAPKTESASFLADYWNHPEHDARNHVIVRDEIGMILLNKYPYSNGHLLVALGEARPALLDYDESQRAALWRLVDRAADLMQRTLEPQGINIGVNQGRAAGAGVPSHLHVHLVPRWGGDTNFMSVVGQVRVIPASLEAMYARYCRSLNLKGSS
ncbi:MAG: HIT family protein [Phycisphaerales bacterium]